MVEGDENANCSTAEGGFATSSETVPINALVEGKRENSKEAAPTYSCTVVDQYEEIELVVAEMAVDERGKSTSTSTIPEAENACQGQGLVGHLCFGEFWLLLCIYWLVRCVTKIKREHGYGFLST